MPTTAKLSMTLRLFSGGDKFDAVLVHGVHTNEPIRAMWEIVDLVNNGEELKIKFPSPDEQKHAAEDLGRKHTLNYGNCIGCTDSLLVWCRKFSTKNLLGNNILSSKFLNSVNFKFVMNLLAACDHILRFIDID